jgi:cobalamin biosynthesis Mg chelatase CobN
MFGSRRHPALGWDQSAFALLSVLALLAFALFPVAASADSAGAEYENAVPTPYGSHHSTPTVVGGGDDKAHASNESGGTPSGGSGGSGSDSSGGSSAGKDPSTGSGNGAGEDKSGNGSTNPQHVKASKDAGGINSLEAVPSPTGESDDGGSSPVVPILIILAVLAAVSVGVVVWQRRRGDTPPITPKAG